MKKTASPKLNLHRETLLYLDARAITGRAVGGNSLTCFFSCAYSCSPGEVPTSGQD